MIYDVQYQTDNMQTTKNCSKTQLFFLTILSVDQIYYIMMEICNWAYIRELSVREKVPCAFYEFWNMLPLLLQNLA